MTITVVCDNRTEAAGCKTEHGLSMWIEAGDMRILFDTGQGGTFAHNVDCLGIDLARADAAVLSHGHYDHANGLPLFAERNTDAPLFVHPAATISRYSRRSSPPHRGIGMSEAALAALRERRTVWTTGPTRIGRHVLVTGPVPRLSPVETPESRLCLDVRCHVVDPLVDDQSMLVETPRGVVLVLGCTHSGVINTLRYAAHLAGCERFAAVIGGMHLGGADAARIDATIAALDDYRVDAVAPCHCTGEHAMQAMRRHFTERFVDVGAGTTLTVE